MAMNELDKTADWLLSLEGRDYIRSSFGYDSSAGPVVALLNALEAAEAKVASLQNEMIELRQFGLAELTRASQEMGLYDLDSPGRHSPPSSPVAGCGPRDKGEDK